MKCFDFSWSVILDIDAWAKWMTIIAVFVAIVAALVAYKQLRSSRKESRTSTAYNIYHSYLATCLQKPGFANGMEIPSAPNVIYGQYCWFVSNMLFSFEQILTVESGDDKWVRTISSQISIHKSHLLKSSAVKNGVWSDKLQEILDEVLHPK